MLREERGWSQSEVARRMKVYGYNWHQTTVGRVENGKRPLRLNELMHLDDQMDGRDAEHRGQVHQLVKAQRTS